MNVVFSLLSKIRLNKMDKLYTVKKSEKYPELSVLKYKNKVFYDNLWNQDKGLLECRGRVVNNFGKTVVNPFTKIFNYQENGTVINGNESCVAVQKINGFMACATYVLDYDDVIISTTGSLDSEYVEIARKYIPKEFIKHIKSVKSDWTYIFEIVAKEDKNIHPIKERYGAYLTGMRKVDSEKPYFSSSIWESSLDIFAEDINKRIEDKNNHILRPSYFTTLFYYIVNSAKNEKNIEGYVVYGQESKTVLKIKTSYYLTKKALMRKKNIFTLDKKNVDEEYYPLIEYCKNIEGFNDLSDKERTGIIEDYFKRN